MSFLRHDVEETLGDGGLGDGVEEARVYLLGVQV